jgi:hypothetical protein
MKFYSCEIKLSQLIKVIGKSYGGKEISSLKKSLSKLSEAVIKVEYLNNRVGYNGKLFENVVENKNEYKISINPNIAYLFMDKEERDFTRIDFDTKLGYAKNGLLGWLYNFYSSHENNGHYSYSLENIHNLSGSKDSKMFSFKRQLKKALNDLEKVTEWKCCIENNKVYVIDRSVLSESETSGFLAREKSIRIKSGELEKLLEEEKIILNDPDHIPW